MEPDEMEDPPRHRRWEDVQYEIERRVPIAVSQAMTPYRLTVDETYRDVQGLKTVVYGSAAQGIRGVVERMGTIEGKLNTIIDQNEARINQWQGIKTALVVIGALSSLPALQALGKLFGLLP
jgi:hypothetical protein